MNDAPACPKCNSQDTRRARREGLLERLVYPRLSLYPWECGTCKHRFMTKKRGKLKRRGGRSGAEDSRPAEQKTPLSS